jgi:acyl carrier protein
VFWSYEAADEIRERLRHLVAEQLGVTPQKINLDAISFNELGADSLDTVELIMELEEEFGLDFGFGDDPRS